MFDGGPRDLRPPIDVTISVNDIVTCCLCPRLLYVKKSLGLLPPPTTSMIRGSLAHNVYMDFSIELSKAIGMGISPQNCASSYLSSWRARLEDGLISQDDYNLIEDIVNFRLRNVPRGPVKVEVKITSTDLGVSGIVDLIEGLEPVEVKLKVRPRLQDYVQLAWYAMLIEGAMKLKVDFGYIDLIPIMRVRVKISDRLRDLAIKLRDEAIRVLYGLEEPPRRVERPLCRSCELSLECKLLG